MVTLVLFTQVLVPHVVLSDLTVVTCCRLPVVDHKVSISFLSEEVNL